MTTWTALGLFAIGESTIDELKKALDQPLTFVGNTVISRETLPSTG
jgi:hypothetical protein